MQDIEFDRGHWAVVTAVGGKKYVGSFNMDLEDVIKAMEEGKAITLYQAFEVITANMPIRDNQGNTGMQRLVQCAPPNNCIAPDEVWVVIGDLQFFEDMQEVNRERHKGLVQQAMAQSMQARLQSSNIVVPQMGMPPGISGGPGGPGGRLPT